MNYSSYGGYIIIIAIIFIIIYALIYSNKMRETFTNPLNIIFGKKRLSCQQMREKYDIVTGQTFGLAPDNIRIQYVERCSGIAPAMWEPIVKGN